MSNAVRPLMTATTSALFDCVLSPGYEWEWGLRGRLTRRAAYWDLQLVACPVVISQCLGFP